MELILDHEDRKEIESNYAQNIAPPTFCNVGEIRRNNFFTGDRSDDIDSPEPVKISS